MPTLKDIRAELINVPAGAEVDVHRYSEKDSGMKRILFRLQKLGYYKYVGVYQPYIRYRRQTHVKQRAFLTNKIAEYEAFIKKAKDTLDNDTN